MVVKIEKCFTKPIRTGASRRCELVMAIGRDVSSEIIIVSFRCICSRDGIEDRQPEVRKMIDQEIGVASWDAVVYRSGGEWKRYRLIVQQQSYRTLEWGGVGGDHEGDGNFTRRF